MVLDFKNASDSVGSNEEVIDENGPGGKYGYRLGHRNGDYAIPDVIINSTRHRKVKVLTVGAGISGILMAYLIQKHCENVEHVIYEKNGDIGGTWLEVHLSFRSMSHADYIFRPRTDIQGVPVMSLHMPIHTHSLLTPTGRNI
jgi:hypothetical protein